MNRRSFLLFAVLGALLVGAAFSSREHSLQLARWNNFLASTVLEEQVRSFVTGPRNPFRGNEIIDSLHTRCLALIDSLGVRPRDLHAEYVRGRLSGPVSLFPPDRQLTEQDSMLLAAPEPCGFQPLKSREFDADRGELGELFVLGTAVGLAILIPLAFVATYAARGWQRLAVVAGVGSAIAAPFVFASADTPEALLLLLVAAFSGGATAVIGAREAYLWVRRGFNLE